MTKLEKIIAKVSAKPTPTTVKWVELKTLLEPLGYELLQNSGSRRKFVHALAKDIISLHEPHPQPEVKAYVIRQVVDQLQKTGKI